MIRRYAEIEHLYLTDEQYRLGADLEAAVVKFYSQILEYEARAVCQFNRSVAVQTLRNIVGADSWESMLGTVKQSATNCEILMQIIDTEDRRKRLGKLETLLSDQNKQVEELIRSSKIQDEKYMKSLLVETKTAREEEAAWNHMTEEARCCEALRTTDYKFQKEKNPDRIPGTCQWFLNHPKYQQWQNGEGSSWLWVTADPGCGKSVLSRFLINSCLETTTEVTEMEESVWPGSKKMLNVCYFFFRDDSEENRSAAHAICALLHQLFSQNRRLVKHALPAFRLNGAKLPQLFDDLWDILLLATSDPQAGTTICLLDALDERSESDRKLLVQKLAKYCSEAKSIAQFVLLTTSRPNTPIGDEVWRFDVDPASIQLMGENEAEVEAISVEIGLVIKEKVKQFNNLRRRRGIDDDTHVSILENLNSVENRTYLWVSLIFPELEKHAGLSRKKLLTAIQTLPKTVDEAYEKILSHSSDFELARKMLHIVLEAVRPLTVAEMNIAFSVNAHSRCIDDLDLEPETSFQVTIRELCGLFVSIRDSKIYLIHQTAKDFLQVFRAEDVAVHGWKHSFNRPVSHLVLAEACIFYLSFTRFGSEILDVERKETWEIKDYISSFVKDRPFLDYAANNWTLHFNTAHMFINHTAEILERVLALCQPREGRFRAWFHIYLAENDASSHCPQGFNVWTVAAYFGLIHTGEDGLFPLLLGRHPDLVRLGDDYARTPL